KGLLEAGVPGNAPAPGVPTANAASQYGTATAVAQATQTLVQPTQALQLVDVFRYYQRLPHQDAAIAWLQQQQSPSVLAEFSMRWRNGSASTTSTVQTTTVTQQVAAPQPVQFAPVAPAAPPKPQPRTLAERLIAYSEDKGYQIDREPGYKNIIYVEGMYPDGRFNEDTLNAWNDARFVIEFKNGVPEIIGAWEATTEPGKYYTMNPCNINGAARIAFGQHKAWQVGTHKDHEALVQTGGAITVYRDLNKDGMRSGDRTETGHFGVNQHWGGDSPTSDIGRWSAGCLVGRTREGHRQFMSIIKQDPRYQKNRGYVFQTIVIDGSDLLKCYPPGGQPAAQSQPTATPAPSTPVQFASPSGGQGGIILKVLNDTVFKTSTQQSHLLPNSDKVLIKAGTQFQVIDDDPAEGNHAKIVLANSSFDPYGRTTWYVFKGHIEIEGSEPDNSPNESEDPNTIKIAPVKTGPFHLPGHNSTFYLSDPVIPGGHFSWAEATKNGTRIPVDKSVVEGIIKIAHVMEEVREYFDNRPITVNSWYRDPASNRKAGGASKSRHLVGDAVDFVVQGISPPEVNRRLESWWGSRGGLASASCFTHIDARGYRARWSYGF
ncbi:MAG TPA: D-Ala-D-Ala carboxypeptidase family metallohydrolase, partial [Coleofasciculaceae cyanobacterium]